MRRDGKGARVRLREQGRLDQPVENASLCSIDIGAAGEVVTVWGADETNDPETVFSSAYDGPIAPTDIVVAAYRTCEPYLVVPVDGLRLRSPAAQILPDGILLVGTRCSRRTGAPELNAEVRDLDGKRLRRGCMGDGIELVRATPSGDVWAGYFDEGIIGNLGWGGVGGASPLGSAGVVRWSSQDFTKLWEPEPDIADVYAGTLVGEDLWTSTYMDFPLRIYSADSERVIPTSDTGVRALITDGRRAVTFGSPGDRSTFRVWDLGVDTQRGPRARGRIALPRIAAGEGLQMMGHHDVLHVFSGDRWFTVSLDEILGSS